jgi:hypothetical protein
MKRKFRFYLFMLIGCLLMAACSNDEKKAGPITIPKKPVIMDPFRFHKLIEVSPGQDYDILSWGRGSTTVGAFEILHSDSAAAKYTTTTGDLAGAIVDVYNSDMDLDGNPEILIQAKGRDTINYTNIYAFEFTNGKAEKLDFPKLTKSQRKGYRGDDNFYIKEGILMREFPIYDGNGKDAKPTGQKREFQYGLRNNSFTIKQLSKDSTNTTTAKPVKIIPVATENKTAATSEKKHHTTKKHTTSKKKKKKHRRRLDSDEGNQ